MSGGDAFFQVDGDMIVAPANPSTNGLFFSGDSTSTIRIETTGKLDVHNATIKAYGITISGNYDQKTGSGTSSVSFHDITTTSNGGAINRIDYGTLEISNQTVASFTDNKASQGAAIYGRYSSLTFTNNKLLTFENNVATNKTGNGGAIYGQTTTLIVTNNDVARFSGNSATGGTGGALRMNSSPEGTTLSNNGVLEFTDNTPNKAVPPTSQPFCLIITRFWTFRATLLRVLVVPCTSTPRGPSAIPGWCDSMTTRLRIPSATTRQAGLSTTINP